MAPTQCESDDGTDVKTVEAVDSDFKCGTEAPAQADGGVPKWFGLCVDNTKCGHDATRLVEVGGVAILSCGHHVEAAADAAADAAGVDLAEREPTTTAPDADDYDVSDTLDALDDDAPPTCDECGTPVVPADDRDFTCPSCGEPRSRDGAVPATDGGCTAHTPPGAPHVAARTNPNDPLPSIRHVVAGVDALADERVSPTFVTEFSAALSFVDDADALRAVQEVTETEGVELETVDRYTTGRAKVEFRLAEWRERA